MVVRLNGGAMIRMGVMGVMGVMAGYRDVRRNVMLVRRGGRRRLRSRLRNGWHRRVVMRLRLCRARQNDRTERQKRPERLHAAFSVAGRT